MTGSYPLPREHSVSSPEKDRATLGYLRPQPVPEAEEKALLTQLATPLFLVANEGNVSLQPATDASLVSAAEGLPIVGHVPSVLPENLGDRGFCEDHGIRFAYVSGAMANGIGSVAIAEAMGKAGMLGVFGAAGLEPKVIAAAVDDLRRKLGDKPFGVNLIHTPQEPRWEHEVVDLLLAKDVRLVEASAYLSLTESVVRYRVAGIHEDVLGRIIAPNQIIAKISRTEVASKFLAPPPEKILRKLVAQGHISEAQAQMAAHIPMAQDLTAEADSGGHTDNRPAIALLPTMLALRDRFQREYGYQAPLRVGLAGGIATPASALAAFSMGAAFVLVGSIHQACVESGSSDLVREMLAAAGQADIAMAPAADMFEMGVNLQVLKRGTMFPMRAAKLYEYYRKYAGLEQIPAAERAALEKTTFRATLEEIWSQTRAYFSQRDSAQVERAERDAKHKMALVFRWYLGKSSGWANAGVADRKIDFQVWCGPAMGAFNEWVAGSCLEAARKRRVVDVARNILFGTAFLTRLNMLRSQGYPLTPELAGTAPLEPEHLKEFF